MKIVYTIYPLKSKSGGSVGSFGQLCNHLGREKHSVTILAAVRNGEPIVDLARPRVTAANWQLAAPVCFG